MDTENRQLVLDVHPDALENSAGFDPDHWPTFADLEWGRDVHELYGIEPYWEHPLH